MLDTDLEAAKGRSLRTTGEKDEAVKQRNAAVRERSAAIRERNEAETKMDQAQAEATWLRGTLAAAVRF